MIRFLCRKCGRVLKASDGAAGREAACPACGQRNVVPAVRQGGGPPAAPAPQRRTRTPLPWALIAAVAAVVVIVAVALLFLVPRSRGDGEGGGDRRAAGSSKTAPQGPAPRRSEPATAPDRRAAATKPPAGGSATTPATQARAIAEKEAPPAPQPRRAGGPWRPSGKPDVHAVCFGGTDIVESYKDRSGRQRQRVIGDRITDLAARKDGSILVCGVIQNPDAVRGGVKLHFLAEGAVGRDSCFVACISADLMTMHWLGVMPAETFRPSRMAVGDDGSIVLVGERLEGLAALFPQRQWRASAAIVKISADGSKLLWAVPGGPNQTAPTGCAVDARGRVYWTAGTVGRGNAAYLLRVNGDGTPSEWHHEKTRTWCVDLHKSDAQLNGSGQFWWFYRRGWNEGKKNGYFDYDGAGKWPPVKFWPRGMRQGGQVLVLPGGDVLVSATMQYDFQVEGKRGYPGFDLFLARYRPDGELLWSSNLYQEGDSVHTPDQKAQDLHYDPTSGDVFISAWQHGSNVYRLKGRLVGDTGNLSIYWIGRVDARTGRLKAGWYFHNIRPDSPSGEYGSDGTPSSGWPKLSGNYISRVRTDGEGRVYVTGRGAAVTWTTPGAWQDWPGRQWGGFGFLYVLSPDLSRVLYGTVIRGTQAGADGGVIGGGTFHGLAVTDAGVYLGGDTSSPGFRCGARPTWAGEKIAHKVDCAIARVSWRRP
jgi:DNA-directed RNA polymerase subunit RPC12/RpoP